MFTEDEQEKFRKVAFNDNDYRKERTDILEMKLVTSSATYIGTKWTLLSALS